MLVLNVLGGIWVVAGLVLGGSLWQSDTDAFGESSSDLADNFAGVLVIAVCGLAATVALGLAAVVNEVSQRPEAEAGRG